MFSDGDNSIDKHNVQYSQYTVYNLRTHTNTYYTYKK